MVTFQSFRFDMDVSVALSPQNEAARLGYPACRNPFRLVFQVTLEPLT